MRYRNLMLAASAPALLALGACDPATGHPTAQQCATAQLGLALAESQKLPPEVIARAKAAVDIFCPPSVAEEVQEDVDQTLGVVVETPAEEAVEP